MNPEDLGNMTREETVESNADSEFACVGFSGGLEPHGACSCLDPHEAKARTRIQLLKVSGCAQAQRFDSALNPMEEFFDPTRLGKRARVGPGEMAMKIFKRTPNCHVIGRQERPVRRGLD